MTIVLPGDHGLDETPAADVAGQHLSPPSRPEGHVAHDEPVSSAPPADFLLVLYADALDDMERTRIANENRLRSLTTTKGIAAGPEVERLTAVVEALAALEHQVTLDLQRAMRAHPLGPWIKTTIGVGMKQGARLLAAIGDPYINGSTGAPRTVSQLWAYCGYHVLHPGQYSTENHAGVAGVDSSSGPSQEHHEAPWEAAGAPPSSDLGPGAVDAHMMCAGVAPPSDPDRKPCDTQCDTVGVAPRRRRGVKANWSSTAKMRAYLIAESCIKHRTSPFRAVYEGRRQHTAVTRPDWTDGHSHNDALRVTAKAVLKEMWIEARRLHLADQRSTATD